MYEVIWLFFKAPPAAKEYESVLPKVDELMLECGWEYSGFRNMYLPVEGTDCDETWSRVRDELKNAEWLKKYEPFLNLGTLNNACSLSDIVIKDMSPVSQKKMTKYSEYYDKTKSYAHGIIVDENNVLKDGYTSYLLAQENGKCPDIMKVRSGQVFKKTVRGKILRKTDNGYQEKGKKPYTWYYNLRAAVVPGDILYAKAKNGKVIMRVDEVSYVAGPYLCNIHKNILKHL